MEKVKVTIRLPKDVVEFGKAAAGAEHRDFQNLVEDALRLYFRQNAQKTIAGMNRALKRVTE